MEITINFSKLYDLYSDFEIQKASLKKHFPGHSSKLKKIKDFSRTSPSVPYNSTTFQDGARNPSLKSLPLLNFVLGVVALANMQKDKNRI